MKKLFVFQKSNFEVNTSTELTEFNINSFQSFLKLSESIEIGRDGITESMSHYNANDGHDGNDFIEMLMNNSIDPNQ